jgi:hypothetical protein
MSAKIDLVGHVYGRLTVIRESGRKYGKVLWECRCICGNTTYLTGNAMRKGNSLSCGCLAKDIVHKHGVSTTRPYKIWRGIMSRCLNQEAKDYGAYGGRGIKICEEWRDPINFVTWAFSNGYSDGLQIDRKDNDGNYCPENCRWVTRIINMNNRGMFTNNKSGYTGVCYHKVECKFQASLYHKGVRHYLGYYDTAEEAAVARDYFIRKNRLPHKIQVLGK